MPDRLGSDYKHTHIQHMLPNAAINRTTRTFSQTIHTHTTHAAECGNQQKSTDKNTLGSLVSDSRKIISGEARRIRVQSENRDQITHKYTRRTSNPRQNERKQEKLHIQTLQQPNAAHTRTQTTQQHILPNAATNT